jgi:inner membrane protein
MDNITHSIVGLGVGELVHRSLPPEADPSRQQTRHRLLLWSCAIASNLPDIDLLLTGLLPPPLGYLLNHRGHTHTVVWAIAELILLCAAFWLSWPAARKLLGESRSARAGLALTGGLGLALHLLMDYCNSYGLHPFPPFDTRWFYGDMLFIVEPLFWAAFVPPLLMTMRGRWPKGVFFALLLGAFALFTARHFLLPLSLIVLLVIAAATAAMQRNAGARGRAGLLLGLVLSLAFVALQGGMSHLGKRALRDAMQFSDPISRVRDVAMTAFPSQPLCWAFVSVESNELAGTYRLRTGIVSLAPELLPPASCPAGLIGPPLHGGLMPAMALQSEETDSLKDLRRLASENCYARAWLRFARDPSIAGGDMADLRFASTMRGNFSALGLAGTKGKDCPKNVPEWGFPRADLLQPAR